MNKGWLLIGLISVGFIWAVSNTEPPKKTYFKPENHPKKIDYIPKKIIL